MQLVHLDTSVVSRLVQWRSREPARYRRFLAVWRETQSQFALSRAHLIEFRRHKDPSFRRERYSLVGELFPGRLGMVWGDRIPSVLHGLTAREIAVYLLSRFNQANPFRALGPYGVGFPLPLASAELLQRLFDEFESAKMGDAFDLFYSGLELDAKVRKRPARTKYKRPRVKDIPVIRPDASSVDKAVDDLLKDAHASDVWSDATKLLTPEQAAEGLAIGRTQLRSLMHRASEVGFRESLAESVPLAVSRRNEYFDVHLQRSMFADTVREVATAFLGDRATPPHIEHVVGMVRVEHCIGTWLRNAVEIELHNAKAVPEPNDWFDLDHLTHLPYVDLFLADGELVNKVDAVLRRDSIPAEAEALRRPVAVDHTSQSLEDALMGVYTR